MELYVIIIAIAFLLLVIIGLAIVNYSAEDMYDKYKRLTVLPCGTTPVELAGWFNEMELDGKLKINFTSKMFGDSISSNGMLLLSSKYSHNQDFGGLVICAHELGHAIQFRDKMDKMVAHSRKVKLSKIVSYFTMPFMISGIVLLIFGYLIPFIILAGVSALLFFVALIAKYLTIGIEKEASKNALIILSKYANFTDEELIIAKKFLNSAKMTYVADLLQTMLKWTFLVRKV